MIKKLDRNQLLEIAMSPEAAEACPECSSLSCRGWASVPGYFDLNKLTVLGTLRAENADDCWDEYHPHGTNLWSEEAPIAIRHHP